MSQDTFKGLLAIDTLKFRVIATDYETGREITSKVLVNKREAAATVRASQEGCPEVVQMALVKAVEDILQRIDAKCCIIPDGGQNGSGE